jgi:hypothetical protein
VGEIGLPRLDYLYNITYLELMLISRGYVRRNRDMWSAIRWQTYNLMCCSMKDISSAGIYSPRDLIHFPWEKEHIHGSGAQPTKEEIEKMRQMMRDENASASQKDTKNNH